MKKLKSIEEVALYVFGLDSNGCPRLPVDCPEFYGDIDFDDWHLESLKGAPKKVIGSFSCNRNFLTSLEYCPDIYNDQHRKSGCNLISFAENLLSSMKGLPKKIDGTLDLRLNSIESFEGCPEDIMFRLILIKNKINSLVGVHNHLKACKEIILTHNPIKEGGLGLLKIIDLQRIEYYSGAADEQDFVKAVGILNKYLRIKTEFYLNIEYDIAPLACTSKEILLCKAELERAGLSAFTKL